MLPRPRRLAGTLMLAGALGALFSAGAARAQVQVIAAPVTFSGGLYNYSYSVTDLSPNDLALVNIDNLPMVSSAATNLVAPAGFQISFDPGNGTMPGFGIVSFSPTLGGTQGFTSGSTVSGFSFSSVFGPGAAPFDTLDNAGGTFMGMTQAPVPEASTLFSVGAGVLLLTLCAVRRRRAVRAGTHS